MNKITDKTQIEVRAWAKTDLSQAKWDSRNVCQIM